MGIEQYERSERALLQRIEALEQLCRDMYRIHVSEREWHGAEPHFNLRDRMEALGLIEGSE